MAAEDFTSDHALLEAEGLDPEKWVVTGVTKNTWEGPSENGTTEYKQTKVQARKKLPAGLILPARTEGDFQRDLREPRTYKRRPKLVAVISDHHAPYHDPKLHDLFLAWLEKHQPDQVVVNGDLLDFGVISRHRHNPEWLSETQTCIDTGYQVLREYVQAAPKASFHFLPGNHSDRIRNLLLDHATDLFGLKRGSIPGEEAEEVLSLGHLLRLDELGISYEGNGGSYEFSQFNISPQLAVRHGDKIRKQAGGSALAQVERLGYSMIMGHTHRQGLVYKTIYSPDGSPQTHAACESGTMAQIKGGLGYAVDADWAQGFATATVFPDGSHTIDLATYRNKALYWRDKRLK